MIPRNRLQCKAASSHTGASDAADEDHVSLASHSMSSEAGGNHLLSA